MVRAPKRHDPDRLFNPDGFRHYRRRYSLVELRWGFAVLALLVAISAWVAYRGARPDPALFAALIPPTTKGGPTSAYLAKRVGKASPETPRAKRGPLPADLAPAGWVEGALGHFDSKNVYEKINGRESYYKSFGFERLSCLLLKHGASGATIDIELFDQGSSQNALGAYAGERGEDQKDRQIAGGLARQVRNALYLTRGRYYLRAIGSDEAATTRAALSQLEKRFVQATTLGGAALPWAYALLARVGVDKSAVTYLKENAFSFDFAKDVYAGRTRKEGPQAFVQTAVDAATAKRLAREFEKSFASYGEAVGKKDARWIKDEFIGAYSTAVDLEHVVVGVRAAPQLKEAQALLEKLKSAARAALQRKEIPRGSAASTTPQKKKASGGEY